jgi:hypothetical protein
MSRLLSRFMINPVWLVAVLASGCASDPLDPGNVPPIQDFVTGEAAAALGADGRFVMPGPVYGTAGVPFLTADQALTLARLYPAQFWDGGLDSLFARGHGSPVQLTGLTSCGPVLFANTPLVGTPVDWDPVARRFLGEWWLVGFCDGQGELQGHVAISAYATDLRIVGSYIEFPLNYGVEFQDSGIPASWQAAIPFSAEGAVAAAYRCTGRRTAEVPWLLLHPEFPTTASKWRVRLESPVTLRGSATGHTYETSEVYVGLFLIGEPGSSAARYEAKVGVASFEQPAGIQFQRRLNPVDPFTTPPPDYQPEVEWTSVQRLPDRPIALEPVSCR